MRADRTRHQRNLRVTSELKTLRKAFEASMKSRQAPQAQGLLRQLIKKLDMASRKGILHRNTVDRHKARLSRRLAQLSAAA